MDKGLRYAALDRGPSYVPVMRVGCDYCQQDRTYTTLLCDIRNGDGESLMMYPLRSLGRLALMGRMLKGAYSDSMCIGVSYGILYGCELSRWT